MSSIIAFVIKFEELRLIISFINKAHNVFQPLNLKKNKKNHNYYFYISLYFLKAKWDGKEKLGGFDQYFGSQRRTHEACNT